MNLFWKKLFGGLMATAKFEKQQSDLRRDFEHYLVVEKSMELEEYNNLFHIIKSADFKEKKKTLQNRKYKDTEEYRVATKYNKLNESSDIRNYYDALKSSELQSYLDFKSSSEYELLGKPEQVKASEKLKAYKDFERSQTYKTYMRFHDSYIIKEHEELKKKVSTDEFVKSNEFWADENRWRTTKEYAQEQRYYELEKNPDIQFYTTTDTKRFDKIRNWKLAFAEDFNWNVLEKSRWSFGFHYKSDALLKNHSFANEQQANNSGKNISVNQGILHIATKEEKVTASAWDAVKGFVEKEFRYTSDVIQSTDKFRQQYGFFQAKIRCSGKINHAFWLGSDQKLPLIKVFHYDGKAIKVGNIDNTGKKETSITGLNPSQFYIYTLVWTEKEMIWLINNLVVRREIAQIPKEAMCLAFNSFISESQKPHESALEVGWVKVYSI